MPYTFKKLIPVVLALMLVSDGRSHTGIVCKYHLPFSSWLDDAVTNAVILAQGTSIKSEHLTGLSAHHGVFERHSSLPTCSGLPLSFLGLEVRHYVWADLNGGQRANGAGDYKHIDKRK